MNTASQTPAPVGIRQVLARYLGRRLATATPVRQLPGGEHGSTWLAGEPGAYLVLRRLPTGVTAAQAKFATAVHDHAAHAGLAPRLLRNDAGQPLTLFRRRYFQLIRHAEGIRDPLAIPDRAACAELGHALGGLHQALASFPPASKAPRLEFPSDPATQLRAAHAAHQHHACPHADVRQALRVKLRRAGALPAALLDDLASLPQQVIHGDVHPGNVILQHSPAVGRVRVAAMIDFDLARYAPPAYELMRALIYCVKPAGTAAAFAPRAAAFLNGYLAERPLSGREIDAMAPLYETVQILDAHGLDACYDASETLLRFGQARFALLYWLRRHGSSLASLTRRALRTLAREKVPARWLKRLLVPARDTAISIERTRRRSRGYWPPSTPLSASRW